MIMISSARVRIVKPPQRRGDFVYTRGAVNHNRRKSDKWTQTTTWLQVTAWGEASRLLDSCMVGDTVHVTDGVLETQEWVDSEGETRQSLTLKIRQGERVEKTDKKDKIPDEPVF